MSMVNRENLHLRTVRLITLIHQIRPIFKFDNTLKIKMAVTVNTANIIDTNSMI